MAAFRVTRSLFEELLGLPTEELVLRLTLLMLILHGSSGVFLDVALQVVCGFMLISPTHHRSLPLWIVVCAFVWWINATSWLWIDNHKYLISYWVLVCCLGVAATNKTAEILAWNGRWLIGLAFGFAMVWKIRTGEYWNGEFLYYTLLMDDRMEFIAHVLGGVSKADLAQARILEETLQAYPGETSRASVPDSGQLQFVAVAMSYWTLAIEAAIAVAFLLVKPAWLQRYRDWLLLFFVGSTYVFVPVLGFGYTLSIMGLASCPRERTWARAAYLSVLILLQLGRLPWDDLPFW